MNVPFVDLRAVHRPIQAELDAAVTRVVQSGWYVLGPEVEAFEQAFARFVGVRHAVGVANGTDALTLALRALGVGPGDEVIVPAMTFIATAIAVVQAGAVPVFADVRGGDLLLDVDRAAAALTPRTKAVVPVHLYGAMADMVALLTLCGERGVAVVEDAAQAHGAKRGGHAAGAGGALGCFSFYPAKNLGALGDGGAVVTNDDALCEHLRHLRNYGQTEKYIHDHEGANSRLDELQAAVLRVKLPRLDSDNAERRRLVGRYLEGLAGLPVTPVGLPAGCDSAHHLFVVRTSRRDALMQHLLAQGVQAQCHYPLPVTRQKSFAGVGRGHEDCPQADAAAAEVLSLPLYPRMEEDAVGKVCGAVAGFFEGTA